MKIIAASAFVSSIWIHILIICILGLFVCCTSTDTRQDHRDMGLSPTCGSPNIEVIILGMTNKYLTVSIQNTNQFYVGIIRFEVEAWKDGKFLADQIFRFKYDIPPRSVEFQTFYADYLSEFITNKFCNTTNMIIKYRESMQSADENEKPDTGPIVGLNHSWSTNGLLNIEISNTNSFSVGLLRFEVEIWNGHVFQADELLSYDYDVAPCAVEHQTFNLKDFPSLKEALTNSTFEIKLKHREINQISFE